MNLLENLTPGSLVASGLTWDHPPLRWEPLPGGGIRVTTPGVSDYFQDPTGVTRKDDAPFLWMSVRGDFVARTHVRPTFNSTYDSGVLMVRHDMLHWAKICFEKTDFGTTAAVSVVTNEVSDDANGVDLDVADAWLQMARVGDVFGLQYSLDGISWRMVRLFKLVVPATIKLGIVAQCPTGPGTTIDFLNFSVEKRTVHSVRAGV
jgi:regulation of enolase protein 1 (concanavalin A-like superfamily)